MTIPATLVLESDKQSASEIPSLLASGGTFRYGIR
jgi:hypothetical protein